MAPSVRRSTRKAQAANKTQSNQGLTASSLKSNDTKSKRTGAEKRYQSKDDKLAARKVHAYSTNATSSPYPNFHHPTPKECQIAHDVLSRLHQADVDREFEDPDTPETIPHVLDAMIIGVLSQATGWSNAKRAMAGMRKAYGSIFAYDEIVSGGMDKLRTALQPGGLHVRKSGLIMGILEQVHKEQSDWNLDYLFDLRDQEAMQELIKYKGIGPKSASVVMTWCLKRKSFTVDTHVYRVAGLWGWRPEEASREKAQAHLDAVIPDAFKFGLHFLLIQHGRTCPACKGGAKPGQKCTARDEMEKRLKRAVDDSNSVS